MANYGCRHCNQEFDEPDAIEHFITSKDPNGKELVRSDYYGAMPDKILVHIATSTLRELSSAYVVEEIEQTGFTRYIACINFNDLEDWAEADKGTWEVSETSFWNI